MRTLFVLASVLLWTVPPARAGGLPPDVAAFVARRENCDHWRGEASPDAQRAADIARAVNQECRGSDAALARLVRRYARNPTVMRRLDGFDRHIERRPIRRSMPLRAGDRHGTPPG